MPARRCLDCDLNIPLEVQETICPICSGRLNYYAAKEPDENWKERVAGVQEETAAAKADPPKRWGVHPEDDSATLVYRDDMDAVLVHNDELVRLGYRSYEPWDVVRLNGKYYELCDLDRRSRFWTIEPLDFYQWATEAILPIPEYDGPSSDDIVAMYGPEGKQIYFNPNVIAPEEEDAA